MFIRSKFEKMKKCANNEILQFNSPANLDLALSVTRKDLVTSSYEKFYIEFTGHDYTESWAYDQKEDRDLEYEWIMEKFSVSVGSEGSKPTPPPEPVKRPVNPKT